MEWQGPDMDELWKDDVTSSGQMDTLRRDWLEEEVYSKLRDLRRGHDFMTYIEILVLVPVCDACIHFEFRRYDETKPSPDVFGRFWQDGYRSLGMSRKQIMAVARALKDGYWNPRCWRCGRKIDLANGESFYTQTVGFSEFFGLYANDSKRIPKWMKEIVSKIFGDKCVACGREANTIDHIIAHATGGRTEVVNLQPLCEWCNNIQKPDKNVDVVPITLTFPLRPPPPGDSDLFIW